MTMIWSLIVLTINSLVLYVVPEGRISYWADWRFLGLTKHDWSAQHTTLGFLFLFAGLLTGSFFLLKKNDPFHWFDKKANTQPEDPFAERPKYNKKSASTTDNNDSNYF